MTPNSSNRHALGSLLAAAAMAVAPHALELPPWVIAVFAGCATWCYLIANRRWYRPGRVARTALMLLVVVTVYRQYGTVLGRDPGIALLIALLGLKLLELKSLRDYVLSLFLLYLIMLGGFLRSQSLWLGAWALLAVIVSTAALMHLIQPTGVDLRQRLRLSSTMIAKALPLMVIVYVLFPRISGTLWGLPADAHSGLTGMPEAIQPGSLRSLSESSEIAFRVTFDGAPPPLRELYWRGLVLTETDGHGWRRGTSRPVEKISFTPLNDPVRYQITLEPSNKPWMPALGLPVAAPKGARYQPDYTLERSEPIRERLSYTLVSHTRYRTGELDLAERVRSLQPPVLSPRVQALAQQWRQAGEPFKVAQVALDYFRRENFVYTLSPPLLGEDPVDEFLFSTRRGFCEHFASAFVTLMRAAGVPSRVVVGYLGGELNAAGNYLIVRQSDAHAWAEIWTPERGWVRVDPTAVVAPERIELGFDAVRRLERQGVALGSLATEAVLRAIRLGWLEQVTLRARWYWDLTNLAWYHWVVDYGKERQERFLASLGLDDFSWERLSRLLFVGALLLALFYGLFLLPPKKSADPAQKLYLRFCRKLARAGLTRAPHEGSRSFAERAARKRADLANSISEITGLYEELRYGRAVSDHEKIVSLKKRVAAFRV